MTFARRSIPASLVRNKRSQTTGFTLVEIILGASVMLGVLTAAYICLETGLSNQRLLDSRSDIIQNARNAFALISSDLRSACRLSEEFEFVGIDRVLAGIEADNIDFATHNYKPRKPGEGDFCEVSYFIADSADEKGLSLWRRRDPSPDPEPLSGGSREEIALWIAGFKLEYYDGFEWCDNWGKDTTNEGLEPTTAFSGTSNLWGIPEAVRITLAFSKELDNSITQSNSNKQIAKPLFFQTTVCLPLSKKISNSGLTSGLQDNTEETGNTNSAEVRSRP